MKIPLKAAVLVGISLSIASASWGLVYSPFDGLPKFIEVAEDIVVAKCITYSPATMDDTWNLAEVEVVKTLKGSRNIGPLKIATRLPLTPGTIYLLTSGHDVSSRDGADFLASAELSAVPLPKNFPLQTLSGSVREQFQQLVAARLTEIGQESKSRLVEQKLLEKAVAGANREAPEDAIKQHGGIALSDGSSYYRFVKDGSFQSGPMGGSGRTMSGKWTVERGRFVVVASLGWMNGQQPQVLEYRRIVFDIRSGSTVPNSLNPAAWKIPDLFDGYFLIEELARTTRPADSTDPLVPTNYYEKSAVR